MSFITLTNYLKARFKYNGLFRKLKRIKFQLDIYDYQVEVDLYSSVYKDLDNLNDEDLKKYYINLLLKNGEIWGLENLFNLFEVDYKLCDKNLREFMQVVIIHRIFKVDSYINNLSIKSRSEVRDSKLNSILN